MAEYSVSLDADEVRQHLESLERTLRLGLEIDAVVRLVRDSELDAEEALSMEVQFCGALEHLEIGVFMDDVDAPDLCFTSSCEALIAAIAIQSDASVTSA